MQHSLSVWTDGKIIDDAEDLGYSWNYSDMTGSSCLFSKQETTNFSADIEDNVPFNSFVC